MTGRPRNTGESFWSRVRDTDARFCWPWGGSYKNGYGRFTLNRVEHYAHRFAWSFYNGPVPDGMVVMHRCNNKRCCNPLHLELGTTSENSHDALKDGLMLVGERHPRTKFPAELIAQIRADPRPQLVLAEVYGVSQTHISRIKANQSRRFDGAPR